MKRTLRDAIGLASIAHGSQIDKSGKPYIKHPMAVMEMVKGTDAKTVAILHDVVEDTVIETADLIQAGFSGDIVMAVDAISRRDGEIYWDYIKRVKGNKLATIVKLADLKHNLSPERDCSDMKSLKGRYEKAVKYLRGE